MKWYLSIGGFLKWKHLGFAIALMLAKGSKTILVRESEGGYFMWEILIQSRARLISFTVILFGEAALYMAVRYLRFWSKVGLILL